VRARLTLTVTALLFAVLVACLIAPSNAFAAKRPLRLLYSSDWLGPMQIFALDPSGREPIAQLTFDRVSVCRKIPFACGYAVSAASPNGTQVAYCQDDFSGTCWVANADGTQARRTAPLPKWAQPKTAARRLPVPRRAGLGPAIARSPNRRWLAEASDDGITLTNRRTGRSRVLTTDKALEIAWAPDSSAIAYVEGTELYFETARTGDLKLLTVGGKARTLVSSNGRYGGQIMSLAWVRPARKIRLREAEQPDGVFAGGDVTRLGADGGTVVFSACGGVYGWTPRAGTIFKGERVYSDAGSPSFCEVHTRSQVYDVAVAQNRIFWAEKSYGQTYTWRIVAQSPIGSRSVLATNTSLVADPHSAGGGNLIGHGGLLAYGVWTSNAESGVPLTSETLFRATTTSCPCPALAYETAVYNPNGGPGPFALLDTDGTRIAALRSGLLVGLDPSGAKLLGWPPVRPGAAQLSEDGLVVAIGSELRIHDLSTGGLRRILTLPSSAVGRDCTFWSEPECLERAELRLQDAAHGLAAYTLNGEVHLMRLSDGHDSVVSFGTEARFMEEGLVVADGARVRLIPYAKL
jgi:hypothetical protein